MIVGSGNIARCLQDRNGAIFFASGVSNSTSFTNRDVAREAILLSQFIDEKKCIFYFSSIGAHLRDSLSAYYTHKLLMEQKVRIYFKNYVILRIGNLIGDTNPNTFINYIKNRQSQGLSVEIKDELRYMIDGTTLNMLCQTLPLDQKIELSVATKIAKVKDLL